MQFLDGLCLRHAGVLLGCIADVTGGNIHLPAYAGDISNFDFGMSLFGVIYWVPTTPINIAAWSKVHS